MEELEADRWPAPPENTTLLVRTVHALRRKKLGELTVEDLRALITQNVGLPFLLPLALEVLRDDPMAEGKYYEGDLLFAVLGSEAAAWELFPDLAEELVAIAFGLPELGDAHLERQVERFITTIRA
ncbi:contact-dependent growth inhibition system immunity protein [Streptomyces sp. NPDC018833]|uniref:contact-dependent growth inhibition system immunity protein n=1 Tax=Streptomyces sp. NPDC018833 TaxID=3365053 RepID=UPI0037A5C987